MIVIVTGAKYGTDYEYDDGPHHEWVLEGARKAVEWVVPAVPCASRPLEVARDE